MTDQADAFAYTRRVIDGAMAWQRGEQDAALKAPVGIPVRHVLLALYTLIDLLSFEVQNETGVPAQRLLSDMGTEMLEGEHGHDD